MIEVMNLNKKFGDTPVLKNINFTIPTNKILGLLGPNGAGKTTLIRTLTRILIPDTGEIFINQVPINKINKKTIGYLPEERGLYKRMKVGEQAIYLATLKGLDKDDAKKRLKEWFDKFEISTWWDKKTETLSKGMQQKIQFIVAVVHQPSFLILDEPFSGLDPINREILGNEILELHKSGMTLILSTHDMNSVEQFCDQVLLMDKGEILLSGKVNEIKQARRLFQYEFNFKKNDGLFVNQCNQLDVKILSSIKNNNGFSYIVKFQNEQESELLLSKLLGQIGLTSFFEIIPTMHDIFVETVTHKNELK